nr:MAG TPA: hypothetical protein [Caudoviricetes sp.]
MLSPNPGFKPIIQLPKVLFHRHNSHETADFHTFILVIKRKLLYLLLMID